MMLTNYFIKKKTEEFAILASTRKHCFRSLESINNVLVLFCADDYDEVKPCIDKLRSMNKMVNTCIFTSKEVHGIDDFSLLVQAKNDLDWRGIPSEKLCQQLNAYSSDLLIDLTKKTNYPMHYLLLQHPCAFKVGIKRSELDLYDFSISATEKSEISYLFEQILFYLQVIRSK